MICKRKIKNAEAGASFQEIQMFRLSPSRRIPPVPAEGKLKNFFPWNIYDDDACFEVGYMAQHNTLQLLVEDAQCQFQVSCEELARQLCEFACRSDEEFVRACRVFSDTKERLQLSVSVMEDFGIDLMPETVVAINVLTRGYLHETREHTRLLRKDLDAFDYCSYDVFLESVSLLRVKMQKRQDDNSSGKSLLKMCTDEAQKLVWAVHYFDHMMQIYNACKTLSVFLVTVPMVWKRPRTMRDRGVRLVMGVAINKPGWKHGGWPNCLVPVRNVYFISKLRLMNEVRKLHPLVCAGLEFEFPVTQMVNTREFFEETRLRSYPESVLLDHLVLRVRLGSMIGMERPWGMRHRMIYEFCNSYIRGFMNIPDDDDDEMTRVDDWYVDLVFRVQYRNYGDVRNDMLHNLSYIDWSQKKDTSVFYSSFQYVGITGLVHESHNANNNDPRMRGFGMIPLLRTLSSYKLLPLQANERRALDAVASTILGGFRDLFNGFLDATHTYNSLLKSMKDLGWDVLHTPDQCRERSESWPVLPYTLLYRYLTLSGEGEIPVGVDVGDLNADERLAPETRVVHKVLMAREMPLMKRNCGMNRSLAETLLRHVSLEADCWQNNTRLMMRDHSRDYDKLVVMDL